uniref:Uncharacterized protein n=1 Tax=viral metagenome TaxID=1070528 RepID=A0A6M3KFL1_9ZZZZ
MALLTSYIIKYKIIPRITGPELRFTAVRKTDGKTFNEVVGIKFVSPKIGEIDAAISVGLDRLEQLEAVTPDEMLLKSEVEVNLRSKGFLKVTEYYEDLKALAELTVVK